MFRKWFFLQFFWLGLSLSPVTLFSEATHESQSGRETQGCKRIDLQGHAALRGGALTPFWAQEYVGADLTRKFILREEKERGRVFSPISVAILDNGFHPQFIPAFSEDFRNSELFHRIKADPKTTDHGTNVANLIAGEPPVGVGVRVQIDNFIHMMRNEEAGEAIARLKQRKPLFTNMSVGFGKNSPLVPLQSGLDSSTIVVMAAGNEFPEPREVDAHTDPNRIYIGNTNIWGWIDDRSREGADVLISAPADNYMTSRSVNGYSNFGGTSGATPETLGALTNAALFLKSLTKEETAQLLSKTSLPTLNSRQVPPRNGMGTLNALKLAHVAKRLEDRGWSNATADVRKNMLSETDLFDFSKTMEKEDRDVEHPLNIATALERGKNLLNHPKCERQRQGFELIRSAFHLSARTPSKAASDVFRESARLLAAIYRAEGFEDNALFLESFEEKKLKSAIAIKSQSPKLEERIEAIRAAAVLGDWGKPMVEKAMQDKEAKVWLAAASYAHIYGKDGLAWLKEASKKETQTSEQRIILRSAAKISGGGKQFLLDALLTEAAVGAIQISPELPYGLEIIQRGLESKKDYVRAASVEASGYFGQGQRTYPVIEEASEDKDPQMRRAAIHAAGNLARNMGAALILKAFSDENILVRMEAVRAAWQLDQRSAAPILDRALMDRDSSVQKEAISMVILWWARGWRLDDLSDQAISKIRKVSEAPGQEDRALLKKILELSGK